jgi:hypothetical protein
MEVRLAKLRAEQQIARQRRCDEQLLQTWIDSQSADATIGDELSCEQLPLPVALPSYLGKLKASQERIPDLRQHLCALAAEAYSQLARERPRVQAGLAATEDQHASTGDSESREDPSESRVDEITLAACSLCRGRCCTRGGNRAYLTANTLTNFAKEGGITNAEQLIEEYLGRVPPRTFQDSCIFHGETGCGLPRAMRSSTCNSYLCVSAQHVRDQFYVAQQSHRGLLLGSTNMDNEGEAAVKVYSLSLVQPTAPSSV